MSKIKLTDTHRAALADWLLHDLPYPEMKVRMQQAWGFTISAPAVTYHRRQLAQAVPDVRPEQSGVVQEHIVTSATREATAIARRDMLADEVKATKEHIITLTHQLDAVRDGTLEPEATRIRGEVNRLEWRHMQLARDYENACQEASRVSAMEQATRADLTSVLANIERSLAARPPTPISATAKILDAFVVFCAAVESVAGQVPAPSLYGQDIGQLFSVPADDLISATKWGQRAPIEQRRRLAESLRAVVA